MLNLIDKPGQPDTKNIHQWIEVGQALKFVDSSCYTNWMHWSLSGDNFTFASPSVCELLWNFFNECRNENSFEKAEIEGTKKDNLLLTLKNLHLIGEDYNRKGHTSPSYREIAKCNGLSLFDAESCGDGEEGTELTQKVALRKLTELSKQVRFNVEATSLHVV